MSRANVLFLSIVLFLALRSSAQTTAPAESRPVEIVVKQRLEPPADPNVVTVRAGEPLVLRTKAAFSSKTLHTGDVIGFEVAKAVTVGDLTIIAEGATATAQVTLAQAARRKGKGGKLALAFDKVDLVDGRQASLRAVTSDNAGRSRDMVVNMVAAGILTYGLASPVFLLQHGHEVTYRKGERFLAELNEDLSIPRDLLAAHQPVKTEPRLDVATIVVIKQQIKGELLVAGGVEVAWHFSIGDMVYQLSPDSSLRIEVPPGKYWLHPSTRQLSAEKPDDVVPVDARGGQTYYFQFSLVGEKLRLIPVSRDAATNLLAATGVFARIPVEEISAREMEQLRMQPSRQ